MDPGWVKTRMGGDGAILEPHESISGMLDTIHKAQKNGETAKYYTVSAVSSILICQGTDNVSAQRKRDPVVSVASRGRSQAESGAEEPVLNDGSRDTRCCNLSDTGVDGQQVRSDIPTHQLILASLLT